MERDRRRRIPAVDILFGLAGTEEDGASSPVGGGGEA